jgi:hypothetical protein
VTHPTKEERGQRKALRAKWTDVTEAIARADGRLVNVGNEYDALCDIARDAYDLAQEVKNLRLHEIRLVNDYNALADAMRMRSIAPFVEPTLNRIHPRRLT